MSVFNQVLSYCLLFILFGLTVHQAQAEITGTLPVHTETVTYQNQSQPVLASGTLYNKAEQKLAFKTSGLIVELMADDGEAVKKGDILATLDLEEINAKVAQATTVTEDARRTYLRYQALHSKKLISDEQLQNSKTSLDVAEADLKIALFNKKHSVIRAPADGVILRRSAEANEMVSAHQPIFVLAPNDKGWIIRSHISDRAIVRVQKGDNAQIKLDAIPNLPLKGKVSEVAAATNPGSRLFEVEITLDHAPDILHSGFIARVNITPSRTEAVAMVPATAIVEAIGQVAKVFKVNPDDKVELTPVELKWFNKDTIAIGKGLFDGAEVVTAGATFLQDGTHINRATP